jgi:hypothetical protein
MLIEIEYEFGEMVYLKHDEEQIERMVTEVTLKSPILAMYMLSHGSFNTWHYGYEIDKELSLERKFKNS